jgi:thiamine-phosphate pyrophosphorylase
MSTAENASDPAPHREPRSILRNARLYVLITESLCRVAWFETAAAVLAGGADVLQLREKGLSDRELLRRAQRLAALCREFGALFIVNDRPDIASLSGADGVHLGQDDMTVADARRILTPNTMVGVSTHNIEQFYAAADAAPDYIAVGPMFATATKPQDHIAGPETLAQARQHCSIPLVAIGGISQSNASAVLAAAPCCLCVCQAVISQPDPRRAAAELHAAISGRYGRTPTTL